MLGYLSDFKSAARGKMKRSTNAEYALRRLREQLGPKRLKTLYGAASLRQFADSLEQQGRAIEVPVRRKEGWEREVPALSREIRMLQSLLVLCHRANRMHNFVDRNIDLSGLKRADDPVMLLRNNAAEELLDFGRLGHEDRMPSLQVLTNIALAFDFNAAQIYPALGPLRLHLAAACAIGRRRRGVGTKETDLEQWGLRGLAGTRFDLACFTDLKEARDELRRHLQPQRRGGEEPLPPPLCLGDGLYNVPIVMKAQPPID
ncbi:hypothetical protein [Devosia sp. RR2S18]|uniref:hypothetical protein n=1 Tax=Devosia rhizosphaerae TaxID=3049774 RepID=UPI0025411A84|nr:hypothetical protein [Devosia sp. RR2S18]WIJ23998.1 hypothetical protein QOV41_13270 [Devosia sp. RR2S18]